MPPSVRALPLWRRLLVATAVVTLVLAQLGIAQARPWGAVGRASEVRYSSEPRHQCWPRQDSNGTTTKVCFHWARSGGHAPVVNGVLDDGDANTIPEWVEHTKAAFFTAWDNRVVGARMRMPLPDAGARRGQGPNTGLDVYLAALPEGDLGYCDYDRRPDADGDGPDDNRGDRGDGRIAAYCVIDNDFNAVGGTLSQRLPELRGTAAHEFFHALQYVNDYSTAGWVSEGTAAWSEGQVFGSLDTAHRYLTASALQNPEDALDTAGAGYGAWLFWQYVSERFPGPIVRQFWTTTRARSDTRPDSTNESLSVLGGVIGHPPGALLADFGAWNYRASGGGKSYADAADYVAAAGGSLPPEDAVFRLSPTGRASTDATGAPNAFRTISTARPSVHYVLFEAVDDQSLEVEVNLPSTARAQLHVRDAGGNVEIRQVLAGTTSATVALTAGETAVLVLGNGATGTRTLGYRAEATS